MGYYCLQLSSEFTYQGLSSLRRDSLLLLVVQQVKVPLSKVRLSPHVYGTSAENVIGVVRKQM